MRIIHTCQHPDGCPRNVKAYGWCRAHWNRLQRSGDPGPAEIAKMYPLGRKCRIDACDKPVTKDAGYGMCGMHYRRWRTHGDPHVVAVGGGGSPSGELNRNWVGDAASYHAAHSRVRRQRGRAADLTCVDCNEQARHWSYNNADPNERLDAEGLRYSTDPAYYEPRCVRCHSAFDRAGERP